ARRGRRPPRPPRRTRDAEMTCPRISTRTCPRISRRRFLPSTMAAASAAIASPAVHAQPAGPRVVVIGGGFGGASCARALREADARLRVTLVEQSRTYTASPMSNAVIAGLRELAQQQFTYDRLARDGVTLALAAATKIDPPARAVTLADGTSLAYQRRVPSPCTPLPPTAVAGYDHDTAAPALVRHAYRGAEQIALLRRQLESMEDGGTVVVAAPVNPARCPPAPYERACLIAHYLKTRKPRAKVIVLDAKDSFTMQKLFENAWKELYPSM